MCDTIMQTAEYAGHCWHWQYQYLKAQIVTVIFYLTNLGK